ncbi:MAG: hypothetical protein AAF741_02030 [Bacteroidota bacterium]
MPTWLFSQGRIDADAFLQMQTAAYRAPQKADIPDYRPPWVDKLEFRTETRDFMFDQQEYLLRLSPVSRRTRAAQSELHRHWLSRPDDRVEAVRQELSYQWHADWLILYLLEQEQVLLAEEADLLADRQILQDNQLSSLLVEASQLIKHEENISKHRWATQQNAIQLAQLNDTYRLENRPLSFEGMPTADQIGEWLLNSPVAIDLADPFAYEKTLLEKEIALEQAEDQRWLDFVQIRYQGPHEDLLTERIALSMGVNIPTPGQDKIKIEELKIEQAEYAQRTALAEEARQRRSLTNRRQLTQALSALQELQSIIGEESNRLDRLFDALSNDASQDPGILLDIRQRQLEQRQQLLEQTGAVMEAYLEYRWERGDFFAADAINMWQL